MSIRSADTRTPASTYRLGEETLAELDYLAQHWGLSSRAEVIRSLARSAAREEGYSPTPAGVEKKSGKK